MRGIVLRLSWCDDNNMQIFGGSIETCDYCFLSLFGFKITGFDKDNTLYSETKFDSLGTCIDLYNLFFL